MAGRHTSHAIWADHQYRVRANTPVTPVIRELTLEPLATRLEFQPGQYVLLNDTDYRVPPRSYSVANAPRPDGMISLLVTRVPDGPTSTWVHDAVDTGDLVTLTGPYGTFVPDHGRSGPVLLLAAGSGLAPARALLESLLHARPPRQVTLFFSARSAADRIDHERFLEWDNAYDHVRYRLTLTRDPGRPDARHVPDLLGDTFGDLRGWEIFASGPPGFVTACSAAAQSLGADPTAIHTEEFFADPQPWTTLPPAPEASVAT